MKDEIKEIITEMQLRNGRYIICKNEDISFSDEDYKAHLLLDYITNLQEELKSTNESITWWNNRFSAIKKENETLKKQEKVASDMSKEYYMRNKKAIKICDEMLEILYSYTDRKIFEDIKDTLNGGDKE